MSEADASFELTDEELLHLLEHARSIARQAAVKALWEGHLHGLEADRALEAAAAAQQQADFVNELELEWTARQVRRPGNAEGEAEHE